MAADARPLIEVVLPDVAASLSHALAFQPGGTELAAQIPSLEIWGRCSCDDEFCASFYTGPRPHGTWSDEGAHQNLALDVEGGLVIIDVVDRTIRFVEVLDRPDVRSRLETLQQM